MAKPYVKRTVGLSTSLSALAGFVDAVGFISLGGYFVSFMTGNTTRLGVEGARLDWPGMAIAGGVLLTFVLGVIVGALIAKFAGDWRRPALLGWVAFCLAVSASLGPGGGGFAPGAAALVLAMGAANSVFQRNGEVTIGVTYMTGTLVKMGQQIANAMTGGPAWTWLRNFVLWLGLALGAYAGALAYGAYGYGSLWIAAASSLSLALGSLTLPGHVAD